MLSPRRRRKLSSRIPDGWSLPFKLKTELARSKRSAVFQATPVDAAILHPSTRPIPAHHDVVVVKAFLYENSKEGLQKCRAEARALRSCAHPYVCEFLGRYSMGGRHFLVTKYYESDLFSFAFPSPLRGPQLSEDECLSVFGKIVLGLDHLHCKGIVHGDVKLENIFISGDTVALGDFGLAKKFDSSTRKTFGPGTVLYAAPETLLGVKVKGPEIDVWAAGVLLYLLIEGFFPYDGGTSMEVIDAISSCGGVPEFSCASGDTRSLICSMLEANPANRASIAEIKQLPAVADVIAALASLEMTCQKSSKFELSSASFLLAPFKTLGERMSPRPQRPDAAAPTRSRSAFTRRARTPLAGSCTPPPGGGRRRARVLDTGSPARCVLATRARSDVSDGPHVHQAGMARQ